jgi:hypothetical protein
VDPGRYLSLLRKNRLKKLSDYSDIPQFKLATNSSNHLMSLQSLRELLMIDIITLTIPVG